MNFSDVLQALNQASAFELFRMRSAIDRVLDEPQRMHAIHVRLQVGQAIEYFDAQANTLSGSAAARSLASMTSEPPCRSARTNGGSPTCFCTACWRWTRSITMCLS